MAMPRGVFNLQWVKLGAREKGWILLWVMVVLGILEIRMVLQPRGRKIREMSGQIATLERERISLLARQPDVQKRQAQIEDLKKEMGARYEELVEAEKELLDVQDADALLESLVKERGRFELALNSIRLVQQKEPTAFSTRPSGPEQEPYRKLRVQIDTLATFKGLVSFVDFLERMRPYQEVEGIKVKVEGKEVSRPHAILLVSALMGETLKARESLREEIFGLLEEMAAREGKDPFLTGERPKEVVQAVGLQLTGIFSSEGRPTAAMINDRVYRLGDLIDGKRIVAIEPNGVLLEYGNRRFILMPAQVGEENK